MSPVLIAVSLKMYFDPAQTRFWAEEVAAVSRTHDAVRSGAVRLIVLPSLPAMERVVTVFAGTSVAVGAQDLFQEDRGPFTSGVSGADLRQLGCEYVEVGHIERRRVFGDDDHVVRLKIRAALRNRLVPILCVGEPAPTSADEAAAECLRQLDAARLDRAERRFVVAYEPTWAIGQQEPAPPEHVAKVIGVIKSRLGPSPGAAPVPVLYGGSAGPGDITRLSPEADGLFLGRFAHDVPSLVSILDETRRLA